MYYKKCSLMLMSIVTYILVIFIIELIASDELHNNPSVDLSKCKLTQLGTEYRGAISATAGGIRCQSWETERPLHEVSTKIKDGDFPEKSRRLANNYCRNPTREQRGPWCYTLEPTLIDDECAVPLCNYGECRVSGIGAEYAGKRKISSTGGKCKSWSKRYKLAQGKTIKFMGKNFPEASRSTADKYCRNPNDDIGGPWCYVEQEDFEIVEKEYCDIPFCDDKDCTSYVRNASVYSTITGLNSTYGNITFWIKLWNPNDERNAEARILLSLLPVPTSASKIAQDWAAGVELIISNKGTGQMYPTGEDDQEFENTPDILVGTNWTGIWLTWGGGFISLGRYGSSKPLVTGEYKQKKTISSLYTESFNYYGFMGTGVLWSSEICQMICEVHTTFGLEFLRVWPLEKNNGTYDIRFYLRASHNVAIRMYESPGAPFPAFTITMADYDLMSVTYEENENAAKQYLKQISIKGLLDFWTWKEFSISIFGPYLKFFARKMYGNEEIMFVNMNSVKSIRWFSIGSENTIAHWTLFCNPDESAAIEDPWPPNCISELTDYNYKGEQWTAVEEIPCIPWTANEVPNVLKSDENYVDGSAIKALNKCRNPDHDSNGPYCFVITDVKPSPTKQYCPIRSCKSSECRMAGTANDYIGNLSITRSNRTCDKWLSDYDSEVMELPKEVVKSSTSTTATAAPTTITTTSTIATTITTVVPTTTSTTTTVATTTTSKTTRKTTSKRTTTAAPRTRATTTTTVAPTTTVTTVTTTVPITTRSRRTPRPTRVKPIAERRKLIRTGVVLSLDPVPTARVPKAIAKPKLANRNRSTKSATLISSPQSLSPLQRQLFETKMTAIMPVHQVDKAYLNDSLYPERSVRNASNYCRDPSRNIAGTWCYTSDPLAPVDLCNVRDCEKPEECIFFVKGHGEGRRIYILPEHRSDGLSFSLKAWEPDQPDILTLVFMANHRLKSSYILKISAANNENVVLYYQPERGDMKLMKEKTLPHLLYSGKWSSFVIRVSRGQISLFYDGSPDPLFDWEDPEPAKAFLPVYYYYSTEKGHTIGVAFDCDSRCDVEKTETKEQTRILPLSIRNKKETPSPKKLQLMIRGNGIVLIPLLLLPSKTGFYGLTIDETSRTIYFEKHDKSDVETFHKQKSSTPIFTTSYWTNLTIKWTENTIGVFCNDTPVFHYGHHSPLLFYFFSLAVDPGGWATWAANCIPPDIDGPPLDGGWSEWGPWACSASCNGGVGSRKRICDSPEPNVRGEPCFGPNVMTGRCNTAICGDIIDDTLMLIKRRIRRKNTALTVKEGSSITIRPDSDLIKSITTQSPTSEIQWSHNGIFMRAGKGRIKLQNYTIAIRHADLNDSGVYTLTVHRVDGTHMIFKVVSLAVVPINPSVTIRETLPISLTCHCVILGYVYSDLRVYWTIGNRRWKDYGIALPLAVNVDNVPAVNKSHAGTWKCVVEQNDLDFKWTTNVILVKVLGPPNWRTHLMEDALTRPIFGWMPSETFVSVAAVLIFLMLTFCIIAGFTAVIKAKEDMKKGVMPVKKKDSAERSSRYRSIRKFLKKKQVEEGGEKEETEEDALIPGQTDLRADGVAEEDGEQTEIKEAGE